MSDIIEKTARFWIDNGGDAEGITWSWMRIRDAARLIEQEKGGSGGS